jgi:polysaccharide pyruvyl transferase WcaK-like protein
MLYWQALFLKAGIGSVRRYFTERNPLLRALDEADAVADISGGDSFTDIYGKRRMFLQTLFKCLMIFMGKRLVLLPQTIGPFERGASRAAARFIIRRAARAYTRDEEGIGEIARIAGEEAARKARFAPDVGLLVEPAAPEAPELLEWLASRSREGVLVGMNVSGLLYNGGYTRANQFGLKADYRAMVRGLLDAFLAEPGVSVVLVPHVVTEAGNVENDLEACEAAAAGVDAAKRERVYVVRERLGVREAKYVIGRCEFFAGSRMHACIAALSQGIAAAGIGYSRKFRGVFETLGVARSVIDLREVGESEAAARVMEEFRRREETRGILAEGVPKAKAMVRRVFEELCAVGRADA